MSSANITIVGNLTQDPQVRQVQGQNVLSFSVAVRSGQKDKDGEYATNFYDCSLWGRRGDYFASRAQKGTLAQVSGELGVVSYQGKDGTPKYALRINAMNAEALARTKGEAQADGGAAPAKAQPAQKRQPAAAPVYEEDDGLPF